MIFLIKILNKTLLNLAADKNDIEIMNLLLSLPEIKIPKNASNVAQK